jgi:hypothetical protein
LYGQKIGKLDFGSAGIVAPAVRICYDFVVTFQKETQQMLSEQQINFNLNAVDNAIAQQTLEGLTVSEDVIINLRKAARGEITVDECLTMELRKYKHAKVRGGRPLSV